MASLTLLLAVITAAAAPAPPPDAHTRLGAWLHANGGRLPRVRIGPSLLPLPV